MGRRRRHDKHLPQRMYCRRGAYYFDNPKTGKWEPLGKDLGPAIAKYGALIGDQWSGRTLGDVIDRYRTQVLPLKRSVANFATQTLQLDRLKRVFGDMLPDSITAPDCYKYLDGRRNKDGKPVPAAARAEISLLRHVLSKAIRWGISTTNVVRNLELGEKSRRTRYVTDEEFDQVYALASPRLQIAMDLALLTGQRRGDLMALKHADCGPDGIVFHQGKTGAGVLVEWSEELRAVVERAKKLKPDIPREYVIRTESGKGYTPKGFGANWTKLMNRAVAKGVLRYTYHDLRAKCASDKERLDEAQALLGHASSATTKSIYKRNLTRARPLR